MYNFLIAVQYPILWPYLVTQTIKNPPAMQEAWVRSLGWEDCLEEDMATHSSILAWKITTDRGAWWGTVYWVTKSWTRLSDQAQHSTFYSINIP